jgi:hypothetical protein
VYGSNAHNKHFIWGSKPLEKALEFYIDPMPILEKI